MRSRPFPLLPCAALLLALPIACATARPIANEAAPVAGQQSAITSPVPVRVDARVELVTALARLAGYPEYQMPGIAAYDAAVDAHFGRFRGHPSVALFRQLRESHGIGYNAPVELALVAKFDAWQPAVPLAPFPAWMDKRWDADSVRAALAAVDRFARDTDAAAFFAAQQPLYAQVEAAVTANLSQRLDPNWYATQTPKRAISGLTVVPALLAGNNSYGPQVGNADGTTALYAVLATPAMPLGATISYPPDAQLALLVHEFHHPYMNPWADAHAKTLLPEAQKLFRVVQARMTALAYGSPDILLYETLVRANSQRYLRSHGESLVLQRAIKEDQDKGFLWVPALAEMLDARAAAGTLRYDEDTARDIAGLLEQWSRDDGAKIVAEQARLAAVAKDRLAQGPQILTYVPAQGAEVDSTLSMLELHFDRPMAPSLAIFGETPEVAGRPSWDAETRVLRLPVRVEPGASYRLRLNTETDLKMKSADGEVLVPREWRFSVRKAAASN